MPTAYLNQVINLAATVLLVPLLLRYLGIGDFVLWAIFTTIGGITQQLESAIQIVTVRDIAREQHAAQAGRLQAAVRRARRAFRLLALGVVVVVLPGGWLYLWLTATPGARMPGLEWPLFVCAYALNYYYGANNSVLLGCSRVAWSNNINSLTRTINVTLTFLLLRGGFAVLGLAASFAASVVLGCMLTTAASRRALAQHGVAGTAAPGPGRDGTTALLRNIARYVSYTLASFLVYRGGVLVGATMIPREQLGSYSLTLQVCAMLTLVAAVPVQVWLARLVQAIAAGSPAGILREIHLTMLAANAIFVLGAVGAASVGNPLLALIGSRIELLDGMHFMLIALGFFLELNIFLLVNVLVTSGNYSFVPGYVAAVIVGTVLAAACAWYTRNIVGSLVLVPLVVQILVTGPRVLRTFCRQVGIAPAQFAASLVRFAWMRR
jgi:hypothetical protein